MPPAPRPTFCEIYDRHVERVYRYHFARTASQCEAEDLTAETFRAALEAFDRYHPDDCAEAWLIGIARHKLADHLRRGYRQSARTAPIDAAEDLPTPEPCPEEQVGRRLEMQRVTSALRRLTPERAEALSLHYFACLGMADVARLMGKSEEAVKKLVQRGLAELRERLKP